MTVVNPHSRHNLLSESNPRVTSGRRACAGWWRGLALMLLLLSKMVVNVAPVHAQIQPGQATVIDERREYNVKAVSLFGFSRYTTWPAKAFQKPDSDLIIGVMGNSRIRDPLLQIARKKTVRNRNLTIRQCDTIDDAEKCHLVFVSKTVAPEQRLAVIEATKKLPVLVVGETSGFGNAGGVANFFISRATVKFELNKQAAAAKGLKLNAKLLALGVEVKPKTADTKIKTVR